MKSILEWNDADCWSAGYQDALSGKGYKGAGCTFPGAYFLGYAEGKKQVS